MPSPRGEQILDRLEEIFFGEGFRRVTVGELAARLHCSRATLYALAPSKEELFLRVLDRVLGRIRRLGRRAAAEQSDVRGRIVAYLSPGMSEMQAASGVFLADIASLPAAREILESHQRTRREEMGAIIDEGIGRGAFRGVHTRLVAEVMMVAIQRVMDPQLLVENRLSAGEAIGEIEDLFLHGLLHPNESGTNPARGDRAGNRKRARRR
jgi:AcrR family transcriptional regulator